MINDHPQSILIVRLSAIGDIVMASGLAVSLREKYPHAHITWLAEPVGAALLKETAYIDEVMILPRSDFSRLWKQKKYIQWFKSVRAFAKSLQQKKFDLALDVQGLLKSAVWIYLSKARRRIGLGSKEGSKLFMHEVVERPANEDMISSEYLRMMRYLDLPEKRSHIGISENTKAMANRVRQNLLASDRYIVFCPFTTRLQKHWVDAYWVELANLVFSLFGCQSVILGGPADKEKANDLAAQSPHIFSLAGETDLLLSTAIIYGAKGLVGVDTGMTHIAHIHHLPCVAIFGSTRPYLDADNPNAAIIYQHYSCSPCRRRPTCGGGFECIRTVRPQEVIEALGKKLNNKLKK